MPSAAANRCLQVIALAAVILFADAPLCASTRSAVMRAPYSGVACERITLSHHSRVTEEASASRVNGRDIRSSSSPVPITEPGLRSPASMSKLHPGNYPLTIDATSQTMVSHRTLHKDVDVAEAPYEKVPLSVPDKFVEPNAAALKKIAADKIVKDKAFADSASKPAWTGNFLPPLHLAPQSDSFGNQRIFNGKLASVHRGLDYRAKMQYAGGSNQLRPCRAGATALLRRRLRRHRSRTRADERLHAPVEDSSSRWHARFVEARSSRSAAPRAARRGRIFISACAGRAAISIRRSCFRSDPKTLAVAATLIRYTKLFADCLI